MVSWKPKRGAATYMRLGYHNPHFHVILNDPVMDNGKEKVICVAFCTYENPERDDDTCLADVGEHPFFSRRSFVNYKFAKLVEVSQLQEDYQKGILHPHPTPVSETLLLRMIDGMHAHARTSEEVNDFFYQHIADLSTSNAQNNLAPPNPTAATANKAVLDKYISLKAPNDNDTTPSSDVADESSSKYRPG